LNTLIDYRYQHIQGQKGTNGMGRTAWRQRQADRAQGAGRDADFDEDRENLDPRFTTLGEKFVLAEGGNGGFGNAHFKSSTNAPRATPTRPEGEERWIWLRLKLIAMPAWSACPTPAIDLALGGQRGQAEDRRLSLHLRCSAARRGRCRCVVLDIRG